MNRIASDDMSREGYTVPSGSQDSPFAASPFGSQPARQGAAANDSEPVIRYLCGDCGSPNQLKKSQPVTCLDCGCRVLYKERTKR